MMWQLVITAISCQMMMSCNYHPCTCVEVKKKNDILLVVMSFNHVNNGEEMPVLTYEFKMTCGQAFVFRKEIDSQTSHLLQHLETQEMGVGFLHTYKRITSSKRPGLLLCIAKINVCYLNIYFSMHPLLMGYKTHIHGI